MNRSKLTGHAIMLTTSVIFGANVPLSKGLMPDWMTPMAMSYSRFAFGAVMFWLLSLFTKREKVERNDMWTLFLGSLLGITMNQGIFTFGLQLTAPTDAAIVVTMLPIFAMILAFLFLKEPITLKKAGGVLLGLAGVLSIILMAGMQHGNARSSSVAGDILCALSSLAYAFFLVVTRELSKKYAAVTLMKWMFLFAAVVTLPFGVGDVIRSPIFRSGTSFAWERYIYLLAGATFFTYWLIPMAQKRIRPTTIGMYNYVQPLVASIIAIIAQGERLTWIKPVAAVMIFVGVYMVTTSKSREDVEKSMNAPHSILSSERVG